MKKLLPGKYIFPAIFLFVFSFTVYSKFISEEPALVIPSNLDEKFDERFLHINSCSRLDSLVSAEFNKNRGDTASTVLFIDSFLRNRFYHSYSELSVRDNWISALCGTLFWHHFLFPVVPCDIIKYPMAACSQQGILFQQQLDRLKITCSTIQFISSSKKKPGHYAVSVYYSSSWHYYDPNREPFIIDSTMPSVETIIEKKLYEKMYSKPSNLQFQRFFKDKSYKLVNRVPFHKGNMYYFQTVTAFLSDWLWLGLLVVCLLYFFVPRQRPLDL